MIGVHVLEVIIIALAVAIIELVRPTYAPVDVLMIIAVGMIAGAIYVESLRRVNEREMRHSKSR